MKKCFLYLLMVGGLGVGDLVLRDVYHLGEFLIGRASLVLLLEL